MYLNLQDGDDSPFFQTAKVRQALLYGLDRQTLIDTAMNGQGLVAHGPIRSWTWLTTRSCPPTSMMPRVHRRAGRGRLAIPTAMVFATVRVLRPLLSPGQR